MNFCVLKCPVGFILSAGVCYKSAGTGPDPDGGDDIPYINPAIQATPVLSSADYTPPESTWDIINNAVVNDSYDIELISEETSNFNKSDYVIRDDVGNIIAAKITGDKTTTDNGDGTSTEVQTQTNINPTSGTNQTTTKTTIKTERNIIT